MQIEYLTDMNIAILFPECLKNKSLTINQEKAFSINQQTLLDQDIQGPIRYKNNPIKVSIAFDIKEILHDQIFTQVKKINIEQYKRIVQKKDIYFRFYVPDFYDYDRNPNPEYFDTKDELIDFIERDIKRNGDIICYYRETGIFDPETIVMTVTKDKQKCMKGWTNVDLSDIYSDIRDISTDLKEEEKLGSDSVTMLPKNHQEPFDYITFINKYNITGDKNSLSDEAVTVYLKYLSEQHKSNLDYIHTVVADIISDRVLIHCLSNNNHPYLDNYVRCDLHTKYAGYQLPICSGIKFDFPTEKKEYLTKAAERLIDFNEVQKIAFDYFKFKMHTFCCLSFNRLKAITLINKCCTLDLICNVFEDPFANIYHDYIRKMGFNTYQNKYKENELISVSVAEPDDI